MSLNTLESLIVDSHQSPESNKIYDIVENFPKYEKCQIQLPYFEKLCKIPFKLESTALLYCFGKVMDTLLFYKFLEIDSFSPNSFIDLLNCLIHVYEKIAGTNLSKSILNHIEENMTILLKKEELNEEEKALIKDFNENLNYKKYGILEGFEDSVDVEEILFYVKSKHIEDKICGTQKLIQYLNNSKGFEEQLEIMGKKLPNIIKYIIQDGYQKDEKKIKDLLMELVKIMTTIVGEFEFFVKIEKEIFANYKLIKDDNRDFLQELSKNIYVFIDGKEENGSNATKPENKTILKTNVKNEAIVHYKIVNYEDVMRNYENIYSSIALIINTILLHPHYLELHEHSFKVLSKLYIIFPKFRKNLEEPLLTILTRISENDVSESKKEISIFLFKLTHKYGSQDFIKILNTKPNLKLFYDSPFFNEKVFKSHENTLEAINPSNLIIKTVFPIEKKVAAGMGFSQIIEVFHPYSIIYIGFATQYYDITFSLKLICLFSQIKSPVFKEDEILIYKKEAINASKNPCRVIYFAKKPGLYKIEFDNSYSWINEKCIRFKILVLQPQNLEFFMTGESLDTIVEEVKTYESLDITEQKKLVKKLSTNFNKITLENSTKRKESGENAETQLERLKLILRDGQDTQLIMQISLENILIIIKSAKAESEWIVNNNENGLFDVQKFYGKVNDFFKRKQTLEESESKTSEKQLISIVFLYNQDAMDSFLRKNLKSFNRNLSFKQLFTEIFNFEQNLPKYFEGVYFHFVRDVNLFLQTSLNNLKNSNSLENPIDKFQKKEFLLLIYFSHNSNDNFKPFIQVYIFDKRGYNTGLFQNNLNFYEDLAKSSVDFDKSLKEKFSEIGKTNEKIDKITEILEIFIFNIYLTYKEKLKMVIFWEPVSETNLQQKNIDELKGRIVNRFEGKLAVGNWIFENRVLKSLNELN